MLAITLSITPVIAFLTPLVVHAQGGISIVDSTAEISFPSALVFKINVKSESNINNIRLHYQVARMNYAQVISEGWPDFTQSPSVNAEWVWDMRKASLPVGATVSYWWTIEDSAGDKLTTPTKVISFDDLRFSWQKLTTGQLSLFWYEGSQSFAKELMSACQQALERLGEDTGAYLENPVSLYIYASSEDLQSGMIFPREWTGGVSFTEYGIIAIGIPTSELDWGKRAVAHELGHMVTHQITFSPYGAILPTWLDEGLAVHAEGQPDPTLESALRKGISQQKLISVRSLASPFSAIPEVASLSYAESQSLVQFLIESQGKEKMLSLLKLMNQGNSCDEAMTQVFGFDQDGLDKVWQEHIMSQTQSRLGYEADSLLRLKPLTVAPGIMNTLLASNVFWERND